MIENRNSRMDGRTRAVAWLVALSLPVMGCSAAQTPADTQLTAMAPASAKPSANAATTAATTGNISSIAARQEFAVERSLGADCPTPGQDNRDYHPKSHLPHGLCTGQLPAHIKQLLTQLPPEELKLSKRDQQRLIAEEVRLRAVPGLGQRADFQVTLGNAWIRSFEGPDPNTTVYLMMGDLCSEEERAKRHCALGLRAYRVQGDAPPRDVTADILPPEPALSATEREFYYADSRGPSDPMLLTNKLYYAPTLRWVMEFDSHDNLPANTPHRLNGNMVHLGFVTWTGTRFELRPTVSRVQWPCYPVAQGEAACDRDEANPDHYVSSDS